MIVVNAYLGLAWIRITDATTTTSEIQRGLLAIDDLRFAVPTPHGGRVQWEYGTFTVALDVLAAMHASGTSSAPWWPPPRMLEEVTVEWISASGTIVPFPGTFTAWLQEVRRDGAVYELREQNMLTATVTDQHYTGTLNQVFVDACAALGLICDFSYARSPSPAVDWRAEGTRPILDNLDTIARFFSHQFFVAGGYLRMANCLADYGNGLILTYRDLADISFPSPPPVSKYTADYSPPSITRLLLAIEADDNAARQACIAEAKTVNSTGGTLAVPSAIAAEPGGGTQGSMRDSNTETYWFSTASAVPGASVVITSTTNIVEYAIQARSSVPTYAPSRWLLDGWCPYRSEYYPLGKVESTGWGSLEQRRFTVPRANWPIELANGHTPDYAFAQSYTEGKPYQLAPACQTTYAGILSALNSAAALCEQKRVRITLPMRAVTAGQRITISNIPYTTGGAISCWFRVRSVTYNTTDWTITVEGNGNFT